MSDITRFSNNGGASWSLAKTALDGCHNELPEKDRERWIAAVAVRMSCSIEEILSFLAGDTTLPSGIVSLRLLSAAAEEALKIQREYINSPL